MFRIPFNLPRGLVMYFMTAFALIICHSNFCQGKIFVQAYSNCDEFPVSLISVIRLS